MRECDGFCAQYNGWYNGGFGAQESAGIRQTGKYFIANLVSLEEYCDNK